MKKVLTIILLSVFFYSCGNMSNSEVSTGSLFVGIDQVSTRTVLPDVSEITPDKYVLSLLGESDVDEITITEKTTTIENLEAGEWSITVKAYVDNDLVAEGTKSNIIIATDETKDVDVVLSLLQTDSISGNTSITLDWSIEPGAVSSIVGSLIDLSDGSTTDVSDEIVFATSSDLLTSGDVSSYGDVASYEANLVSGDYILTLNLYDEDDNLLIPYGEVIQVYNYVDSNDSVVFVASDFNDAPVDPSSITVAETESGILVQWVDQSNIETGYIIERWNGSEWEVLGTVASGSESFTDSNATAETEYTYRVKATGYYGDSDYIDSDEVSWTTPVPGNTGTLTTSDISNNAFDLSWTEATDANDDDLLYKIVISTSNENMGSVANTEVIDDSKTIVMDWVTMGGNMSFDVTGLVSGTTYYINVLVKDSNGNKASYNETSDSITQVKTSSTGSLGVSITIEEINDIDILFVTASGTELEYEEIFSKTSTISIQTSATYDDYIWFVDNAEVDSTTTTGNGSRILTINASTLNYGKHTIMVAVGNDDGYWSESTKIVVGN